MDRKKTASFGEALERYLADTPLADGLREGRVCAAWDTAVGPSVAGFTLSRKYANGVLTVRLGSSVLRSQLNMSKETIRARINEILGSDLVSQINLR